MNFSENSVKKSELLKISLLNFNYDNIISQNMKFPEN
jgi:hypothetical protein